jgi:xanthine dehydrogenase accessory factor
MAEVLAVKNGVTLPRDMEVAWAKDKAGITASGTDAMCSI